MNHSQCAAAHLGGAFGHKPAVAFADIGFVAQQTAALPHRPLGESRHGFVLSRQIRQEAFLKRRLVVVNLAPVTNIARRSQGANMRVLQAVICRRLSQCRLREARLAALRQFPNVQQSLNIVINEGF